MPPTLLFWIGFVATVVLIGSALFTGLTRRRVMHLWLGPLAMVALTVTIVLTEELMRRYQFPEEALAIHLKFATAGGLLGLPVIATGLWLWRSERARRWHRVCVWVWLLAVLLAVGTGLWMFAQGTLRAG